MVCLIKYQSHIGRTPRIDTGQLQQHFLQTTCSQTWQVGSPKNLSGQNWPVPSFGIDIRWNLSFANGFCVRSVNVGTYGFQTQQ